VRGNVDVGCSALGDGFLSGLAMSENGLGGGADVKGDGRPGAGCIEADGGGGAYPSDFLSEKTSEMEGKDCRWAWPCSDPSEGLRGSTGEIMPGIPVVGAE
jgi:hypothetical protein